MLPSISVYQMTALSPDFPSQALWIQSLDPVSKFVEFMWNLAYTFILCVWCTTWMCILHLKMIIYCKNLTYFQCSYMIKHEWRNGEIDRQNFINLKRNCFLNSCLVSSLFCPQLTTLAPTDWVAKVNFKETSISALWKHTVHSQLSL